MPMTVMRAPDPTRVSRRWLAVLAAFVVAVLAVGTVGATLLWRRARHPVATTAAAATATTAAASPSVSPTGAGSPTPTSAPSVGLVDVSAVATDARAADIAAMFDAYFSAINARDFTRALQVYDPAGSIDPADPKQRKSFADGVRTTKDSAVALLSITGDAQAAQILARVRFTSHQQPGYGPKARRNETCTRWDVTYQLTSPAEHQYRVFGAASAANQPC
jgi:hypothetical protein